MSRSFGRPDPRLLIVPIETKSREFQGKVFFASRAVARGFEVWLGSSREFVKNLHDFPLGVYVSHHVGQSMRSRLPRLAAKGMGIVAWDEESLVVKNDSFYVDERVPRENISHCHRFFTRGEGDKAALAAAYPEVADRLVATGNPRIDILDQRYLSLHRDPTLSTRAKRILVASRFALANPSHMSRDAFRALQLRYLEDSPESQSFKNGYMNYTLHLYEAFLGMVEQLASSCREHEVVIRPHPSEKDDVWREMAERFPNVTVTKEGTATAWALASDVLVHNGCTTGIEAALLGCHVLAYCPTHSDAYDVHFPNQISEKCTTVDALKGRIDKLSRPDSTVRAETARRARAFAGQWIAGLDGNRTASDLVLDELERVTDYPARNAAKILSDRVYRVNDRIRRFLIDSGFNVLGHRRERRQDAYFKSEKFSGLNEYDVQWVLDQIGADHVQIGLLRNNWVRLTGHSA